MKEATGELNMTVITLVAVAAVGALFYFVIWPVIQQMVMTQTCQTYGSDWTARKVNASGDSNNFCPEQDNEKVDCWACCPDNVDTPNKDDCMVAQ